MSELEAELRSMEDDIQVQSKYMGRLKGEFTANRNKLRESYWPKMNPLHTAVYMSGEIQRSMETEIEWMEKKVVMMENLKSHFIEIRDMSATKKKMFDALQPRFEDAYLSLESVTKEELAILRGYEHPPQIVLDTMGVVMVLRNEEDPKWEDAKLILSETYFFAFFISKCRHAHKQEFSEEQLDALQRYLLSPESAPDAVAAVSVPCGAIAKWLRALHDFFVLTRITTPKSLTLEELKDALIAKRKALQQKKEDIAEAQDKLKALSEDLAFQEKQLIQRYDETMIPLQENFFEATHKFNDVFCSPRRRHEEGLA